MKNNFKKLFVLGIAALMTGCTAKSIPTISVDFYTAQGFVRSQYIEMLENVYAEKVINGTYVSDVTIVSEGVSSYNTVTTVDYDIDFVNLRTHLKYHTVSKLVDFEDPTINIETTKDEDLWLFQNNELGFMHAYVDHAHEESKFISLLQTNAAMYQNAMNDDLTFHFYAADFMYYRISMELGGEVVFGVMDDLAYYDNEYQIVGSQAEMVNSEYLVNPEKNYYYVKASSHFENDPADAYKVYDGEIESLFENYEVKSYTSNSVRKRLTSFLGDTVTEISTTKRTVSNKKGTGFDLPDFSDYTKNY